MLLHVRRLPVAFLNLIIVLTSWVAPEMPEVS
jgi:hypothetical protein